MSAGAARAAELSIATAVPEAGMVRKTMRSIVELRFDHLVRQQTDYSCGAAALATILNHAYGRALSEAQVIRGMLDVADTEKVRAEGFSMLDMKRYAETLGLRGRGFVIQTDAIHDIRVPVVTLLDVGGYRHFVVFKKAVGDQVFLGDPSLGNRVMNLADFVRAWNGIVLAIIGPGFDRNTVLLNPAAPLTLRQARGNLLNAVSSAVLLEFGFTHADLF
ncbi:MAG: C39 family peptidase [Betaproteobacteria bacterium]|nr:C39 family peptidase [Betaproteobacteria bacterium]